MKLLTCILTENDCCKIKQTITPKGVMVHSTGANNPMLKRYVQPVASTPDRAELLAQLGTNANRNHWNQTRVYKYTDGTQTVGCRNTAKTLKQTLYNACVHGFIGKLADGTVAAVQTLPWNHLGWHAASGTKGSANDTHISFEICEDGLTDKAYFNKVYREAVELTAMLCKQYGLDPLADGVVICHVEGYKRGIASNHGDVLHWWPKHGKTMDDFRAAVAAAVKQLAGATQDATTGAAQTPTASGGTMYRVRKTWADTASQIGAFTVLNNAKRMADSNPGYTVFDAAGLPVYPVATFEPYRVQVTATDLQIRTGPGTNHKAVGVTGKGVFTIVEESAGAGSAAGWGRLKSGAGWIALDYCTKL